MVDDETKNHNLYSIDLITFYRWNRVTNLKRYNFIRDPFFRSSNILLQLTNAKKNRSLAFSRVEGKNNFERMSVAGETLLLITVPKTSKNKEIFSETAWIIGHHKRKLVFMFSPRYYSFDIFFTKIFIP